MNVGASLKRLFDNKPFEYTQGSKTTKTKMRFHYGDQFELNKWIVANKSGKYPLIYYVLGSTKTDIEGLVKTNARLVLMVTQKYEVLNDTRQVNSYETILNKLLQEIKDTFSENLYITIYGDKPTKYKEEDEPLFGLGAQGLQKIKEAPTQGVSIDIVDAKILDFEIEINTNCI